MREMVAYGPSALNPMVCANASPYEIDLFVSLNKKFVSIRDCLLNISFHLIRFYLKIRR